MSSFDDSFKRAMAAATAAGKRHPIIGPTGEVVGTSRNLAGIRRLVSKKLIKELEIGRKEVMLGEGSPKSEVASDGVLRILFDDGTRYATDFASYTVLKNFVRQWRNVYGAPLLVEGKARGKVDYKNEALT
jgi:hypothetical protein